MAKHAILSASGAHRWLNCTASIMMEKPFKDGDSAYAQEGTEAHELAENMIDAKLRKVSREYEATPEMMEYIGSYSDWVIEYYNKVKKKCLDAQILLEQRLDFSRWVPDGFGTGDVVIIADGTVHVIDLKYGKGVPVSAESNPQLMLYGLGAVDRYELEYEFDSIRLVINQPRLDSISEWEIYVDDLIAWGEDTVKPKAEEALSGIGTTNAGEHCRFCKAAAVCRARAEEALRFARADFNEATLDDAEIAEMLGLVSRVTDYCNKLTEYTLAEALKGKKWSGYKVVEGRSRRKYADDLKVAELLNEAGYEDAIIYERKLLGLTAMEKVVGKKNLSTILGDCIIKPAGAPVLVPESDKRPEYTGADDFNDNYKED